MSLISKYAELLIKIGVNIQKGQTLVISSPIECAEFARLAQAEAYRAGAKEVVMRWVDEKSDKITYTMADDAIFDEVPDWLKLFFNHYSDTEAAFLHIAASDPSLMKDVDPKRIARQTKARSKALEHYRERQMSNKHVWCVASVPTLAWAKKVFPSLKDEEAVDALWSAIFKAVRADSPDPVEAWKQHAKNLHKRTGYLNNAQFKTLRYKNSLGTDLHITMPKNHVWYGGSEKSSKGYEVVMNMPTEEVFTLPHKSGANGKIVASLPLNYNGNLVKNFWFVFKDGLVVDYGAEEGLNTLKELVETDDGAKRLGEVALVPHDSPISNQRILFYNTLFDENASCHFALGKAYPSCIKGGEDMDKTALTTLGVNDSLIHVDFMVGSKDLEITGIKDDGTELAIFRNGNFVI